MDDGKMIRREKLSETIIFHVKAVSEKLFFSANV